MNIPLPAAELASGDAGFSSGCGAAAEAAAPIGRTTALPPVAAYDAHIASGAFQADAAQQQAVAALQHVYDALVSQPPRRGFGRRRMQWPKVQGLYLWGGVGRGKTWLMNSFYEALPFSRKKRTHFHRFMLDAQAALDHYKNESDPLLKVARELSGEFRVLCFDEFQVFNIADAMIIGRLFNGLFARGVTLVTTSNVMPDDLYKDGLQRQRFLPAIAALNRNCTVLNVDSGVDYRLRSLHEAPIYLCPDDAAAERGMALLFEKLAGQAAHTETELAIQGRQISAHGVANDTAWFSFEALCNGPRGTADYVDLAQHYHTVLLSGVPQFGPYQESQARRFINLVDEFYDRSVNLIVSAAARPEHLYTGKRLVFEFERTCSRLIEMQSEEYLASPHLP